MAKADLTYIDDGMFVRFFPEAAAGEDAWRLMAGEEGVAAFLAIHADAVIRDLRRAGYRVRKHRPRPMSAAELDRLLADLAA